MGQPLDGVEAKLWQAKRHMYAFRAAYQEIREADPIGLGLVEEDRDGGRYLVEVQHFPVLTPRLGVIVGDAVHCFRSALDHLVYEAGRQHIGKGSDRSQFPITKNAAEFRGQCYRISDLSAEQRAIIEWAQPYNRGDEISPLHALNSVSNTDKHRVLNPMLTEGTLHSESGEPFRGVGNCKVKGFAWIGSSRGLKVGAKIARLELGGDFAEPHVNMEGAFIPEIAFEGSGQPVIDVLLRIGGECMLVVEQFEGLLEPRALLTKSVRRWPNFNSWPYPIDI